MDETMRMLENKALAARAALILFFVTLSPNAARADSVLTAERSVTKVAEGVYVIRHPDAPDTFPQGNTTVVIGDREVLVVDTCYLPSSAREDIAQIRTWTDKPVRYVVNTHWHYDHTMGNSAYVDAFPGATVIAQVETRNSIRGYTPGWFERFPKRGDGFKQRLDTGKDLDGTLLTDVEKKDYATALAGLGPVGEEFKTISGRMRDITPSVTFEDEMTLDVGNREVQIRFLGRGNTAGDSVVYLPRERILVAGDLLDHPVPYLGGGYPRDLVQTLERMSRIDARTIVPGHGKVLEGEYAKAYLRQVIDLVDSVSKRVSEETYRIGNGTRNLEAVREGVMKSMDMAALRRKFAGDDKDNGDFFDQFSLQGLITAAFNEICGR